MIKKNKNRILFFLAITSFMISIFEGYFYYEDYRDFPLIYILMIFLNSVKCFMFSPDISIANVVSDLKSQENTFRYILGYSYTVSIVIAYLCTTSAVLSTVELMLKRKLSKIRFRSAERILIFGYNENVRTLLRNMDYKKEKKLIYLVTIIEITDKEELNLIKKGISVHRVDCLNASDDVRNEFYHEIHLSRINRIIFFETSSANNFSLYLMLKESGMLANRVKCYCSCEDEGTKQLIRKYYDQMKKNAEEKTQVGKDKNSKKNTEKNSEKNAEKKAEKNELVIFNIDELKIRKMFDDHHLFQYNIKNYFKDKNQDFTIDNSKAWDVHMLIIGLGSLGRQILLHAINLGMMHSNSSIVIDVIDSNIAEKKSIFENIFSSEYVEITNNEIMLRSDHADGILKIRFKQMDIREKVFERLLEELSVELPFTYAAITMQNSDISTHCMMTLLNYLIKKEKNNIPIGIRMEVNQQVAKFLDKDTYYFCNVFSIGINKDVLTLESIWDEKALEGAKNYNQRYNKIDLESIEQKSVKVKNTMRYSDNEELIDSEWNKLTLWEKDSNKYLYYHDKMKRLLLSTYGKKLTGTIGDVQKDETDNNKIAYKAINQVFNSCDVPQDDNYIEELIKEENMKKGFIKEMAMLEHRRWCYFMACNGWQYTSGAKDEKVRKNPCMTNWENLCKSKPDKCKYDLMPLMVLIEEVKQNSK